MSAAEIAAEAEAWSQVEGALSAVADLVRQHPDVWKWGDGYGGEVHRRLDQMLADRFPSAPSRTWPR